MIGVRIGVLDKESAAPTALLCIRDRVPVLTHWASVFRASCALLCVVEEAELFGGEVGVDGVEGAEGID